MKILLIANTLPPSDLSGVGEQVMNLAAGLRARGHDVEILGRGGAGARGSKLQFPLRIVAPGLRRVDDWKPDVVQLHESDGGLLATSLIRRSPRPLLVSLLQVSYSEERRAVRPLRWNDRILGRPGATEMRFRWLKAPLQIALGRRTARSSDLVIAPSRETARELERDYGVQGVVVVPNAAAGRRPEARRIAEVESVADRPLLFVGRLRIRKGIEVLLAALALLREQGLRPPLWIVGSGEHGPALADSVRSSPAADQIRFLGRRPPAEVRWAMERCAALAVPSTYEGMPLVILEAMAAARPVVASRVSGIPEVVLDGETGWLVAAEDPVALAGAVGEAVRRPEEADRRGSAGRRRLELEYGAERVAGIWERVVTAAIERRGSG
ncbi:MAG: glycosyltransferase family 4 protein [Thermoanaerobaculia bacterium]